MHADLLTLFGGLQGWGAGDLEAVLTRPQMLATYDNSVDAYDLAAAYAEALARGHVFADGNKRIAFDTARVFLRLNKYSPPSWPQEQVVERTLALAADAIDRNQYADFLRG
jgi:death-on-curing protein